MKSIKSKKTKKTKKPISFEKVGRRAQKRRGRWPAADQCATSNGGVVEAARSAQRTLFAKVVERLLVHHLLVQLLDGDVLLATTTAPHLSCKYTMI